MMIGLGKGGGGRAERPAAIRQHSLGSILRIQPTPHSCSPSPTPMHPCTHPPAHPPTHPPTLALLYVLMHAVPAVGLLDAAAAAVHAAADGQQGEAAAVSRPRRRLLAALVAACCAAARAGAGAGTGGRRHRGGYCCRPAGGCRPLIASRCAAGAVVQAAGPRHPFLPRAAAVGAGPGLPRGVCRRLLPLRRSHHLCCRPHGVVADGGRQAQPAAVHRLAIHWQPPLDQFHAAGVAQQALGPPLQGKTRRGQGGRCRGSASRVSRADEEQQGGQAMCPMLPGEPGVTPT
jgi:hypothetical protein